MMVRDLKGRPESELADVFERLDNGDRLAMAVLQSEMAELTGEAVAPDSLSDAGAQLVATDLMEARGRLVSAGGRIPLGPHGDLHKRLNALINEIDLVGVVLAERWGE